MNQTAVFLYVLAPWCNVHLFIPISILLSADISLHNHNAMKLVLIVLMILV